MVSQSLNVIVIMEVVFVEEKLYLIAFSYTLLL